LIRGTTRGLGFSRKPYLHLQTPLNLPYQNVYLYSYD
jgi:hypothetical protein